jgi:uncharacterized protein YoxC
VIKSAAMVATPLGLADVVLGAANVALGVVNVGIGVANFRCLGQLNQEVKGMREELKAVERSCDQIRACVTVVSKQLTDSTNTILKEIRQGKQTPARQTVSKVEDLQDFGWGSRNAVL